MIKENRKKKDYMDYVSIMIFYLLYFVS